MTRALTWNLYHGTFNLPAPTPAGASPLDRLAYIANIAQNIQMDIICLQEVPQATLDAQVAFGVPAGGTPVLGQNALGSVQGFLANYTVLQAYAENNPNQPRATNTTDGYLILFRKAAFPGPGNGIPAWSNFNYYQPAQFANQYGAHLRPPVTLRLTDNAANVTSVLNWHAETGPGAGWSLEILDQLVGNANNVPNPVVICGDYNVRGDFSSVFGNQQNFPNWTNVFAVYNGPGGIQISGLDHILTSAPSGPVNGAQLQFTSDAYHYPIAAQY